MLDERQEQRTGTLNETTGHLKAKHDGRILLGLSLRRNYLYSNVLLLFSFGYAARKVIDRHMVSRSVPAGCEERLHLPRAQIRVSYSRRLSSLHRPFRPPLRAHESSRHDCRASSQCYASTALTLNSTQPQIELMMIGSRL